MRLFAINQCASLPVSPECCSVTLLLREQRLEALPAARERSHLSSGVRPLERGDCFRPFLIRPWASKWFTVAKKNLFEFTSTLFDTERFQSFKVYDVYKDVNKQGWIWLDSSSKCSLQEMTYSSLKGDPSSLGWWQQNSLISVIQTKVCHHFSLVLFPFSTFMA